ncbi:sugar transferase [Selenomonas sp. FC4001]|uniref:sugar transferase n=1 Tax=Selenomonas sp. FC4001 TaxID=1408313 RepID=UPI0005621575|nr:sugar transferase [Selenomonas sp. FC4001]
MAKRLFDLLFTIPGVIILSPMLIVLALWVHFDSDGPVFFRQERVGRNGINFRIFKFRTMVFDAESRGTQITVGADKRVTRCGEVLRKYKLDELPQLFNVILGDMSLVGPRPEVPCYIAKYTVEEREEVLSVRPGITDNASIVFRSENEILGRAQDPEWAYINEVLPIKIKYYREYVQNRSLVGDFMIILKTFKAILD